MVLGVFFIANDEVGLICVNNYEGASNVQLAEQGIYFAKNFAGKCRIWSVKHKLSHVIASLFCMRSRILKKLALYASGNLKKGLKQTVCQHS